MTKKFYTSKAVYTRPFLRVSSVLLFFRNVIVAISIDIVFTILIAYLSHHHRYYNSYVTIII